MEYSDSELIDELDRLRKLEREQLPHFLACLAEVERRGAHLDRGHANLFAFCVEHLRYPEGAAARRVFSARAAARFPALYVLIRDGALSLTAVSRLEPHLTPENFDSVVARAIGKRQREIESLIVELIAERRVTETSFAPAPIESLPPQAFLFDTPTQKESPALPTTPRPERRPDTIRLEAPDIVRFSFQANERLRGSLALIKNLLKHSCPSGRLEDILERVLDDFLSRHGPSRKKTAPERPPRTHQSRRVPQWVKDRVWARDEGRCSYVSPDGRRCSSRSGLEYDHVLPWARGGASDDPENVRLLCRAHNLRLARRAFGAKVPAYRPRLVR